MKKLQILIPYPLFAEGLTQALAGHFLIVEQEPDVLLVDTTMLRNFNDASEKVIAIGWDEAHTAQMLAMIRRGVHAYAGPGVSIEMLIDIINLVLAGNAVWPQTLVRSLTQEPFRPAPIMLPAPLPSAEVFSPREKQLIIYISQGLSNKLIARETQIAEATVKVHVKAILRKLRVANRTQAAIWAHNNGHGRIAT